MLIGDQRKYHEQNKIYKEKVLSTYNTVTAGSKKEKHCHIVRFHLNTRPDR